MNEEDIMRQQMLEDLGLHRRDKITLDVGRDRIRIQETAALPPPIGLNEKDTASVNRWANAREQLAGDDGGNVALGRIAGGQQHRESMKLRLQQYSEEDTHGRRGHAAIRGGFNRGRGGGVMGTRGRGNYGFVAEGDRARVRPLDPAVDPDREYTYKGGKGLSGPMFHRTAVKSLVSTRTAIASRTVNTIAQAKENHHAKDQRPEQHSYPPRRTALQTIGSSMLSYLPMYTSDVGKTAKAGVNMAGGAKRNVQSRSISYGRLTPPNFDDSEVDESVSSLGAPVMAKFREQAEAKASSHRTLNSTTELGLKLVDVANELEFLTLNKKNASEELTEGHLFVFPSDTTPYVTSEAAAQVTSVDQSRITLEGQVKVTGSYSNTSIKQPTSHGPLSVNTPIKQPTSHGPLSVNTSIKQPTSQGRLSVNTSIKQPTSHRPLSVNTSSTSQPVNTSKACVTSSPFEPLVTLATEAVKSTEPSDTFSFSTSSNDSSPLPSQPISPTQSALDKANDNDAEIYSLVSSFRDLSVTLDPEPNMGALLSTPSAEATPTSTTIDWTQIIEALGSSPLDSHLRDLFKKLAEAQGSDENSQELIGLVDQLRRITEILPQESARTEGATTAAESSEAETEQTAANSESVDENLERALSVESDGPDDEEFVTPPASPFPPAAVPRTVSTPVNPVMAETTDRALSAGFESLGLTAAKKVSEAPEPTEVTKPKVGSGISQENEMAFLRNLQSRSSSNPVVRRPVTAVAAPAAVRVATPVETIFPFPEFADVEAAPATLVETPYPETPALMEPLIPTPAHTRLPGSNPPQEVKNDDDESWWADAHTIHEESQVHASPAQPAPATTEQPQEAHADTTRPAPTVTQQSQDRVDTAQPAPTITQQSQDRVETAQPASADSQEPAKYYHGEVVRAVRTVNPPYPVRYVIMQLADQLPTEYEYMFRDGLWYPTVASESDFPPLIQGDSTGTIGGRQDGQQPRQANPVQSNSQQKGILVVPAQYNNHQQGPVFIAAQHTVQSNVQQQRPQVNAPQPAVQQRPQVQNAQPAEQRRPQVNGNGQAQLSAEARRAQAHLEQRMRNELRTRARHAYQRRENQRRNGEDTDSEPDPVYDMSRPMDYFPHVRTHGLSYGDQPAPSTASVTQQTRQSDAPRRVADVRPNPNHQRRNRGRGRNLQNSRWSDNQQQQNHASYLGPQTGPYTGPDIY